MDEPLSHFTRRVARAKEMLSHTIPGSLDAAWAAARLEKAEIERRRSKRSRAVATAAPPSHIHIHEVKGIKMDPTEKSRLASILCAPLALKYPAFAQELAFNSELSVKQALEILAIADRGATAQAAAPRASAAPNRLCIMKDDGATESPPDVALSWGDIASRLNEEARAHNPHFMAPTF